MMVLDSVHYFFGVKIPCQSSRHYWVWLPRSTLVIRVVSSFDAWFQKSVALLERFKRLETVCHGVHVLTLLLSSASEEVLTGYRKSSSECLVLQFGSPFLRVNIKCVLFFDFTSDPFVRFLWHLQRSFYDLTCLLLLHLHVPKLLHVEPVNPFSLLISFQNFYGVLRVVTAMNKATLQMEIVTCRR